MARETSTLPTARARAFVRFTLRYGRWLWAAALLLAIPAGITTVGLYTRLSSDIEELLPREAPSVVAIEELRRRMPGLQYLGVVVDTGSPQQIPAAERLLDDLAARVRTYPKEMVRAVKVGAEEERRFVERHAALYAELGDLTELRERLAARKRWEASKQMGILLDDEPAPSLDFSSIARKYEDKAKGWGRLSRGRFSNPDLKTSLLLIEVGGFSTSADSASALLDRVKEDLAALGAPDKYAPRMRIGFSADVAVSAEEISALEVDLTMASLLVLAAVIAVILAFFRWGRSVPALFLPLLVAVLYAFGLSTLPPWNVDRLNSNTAFLASIIVGNGVNFAILFLARYVEARRRGVAVEDSLVEAVWGSRLGTLMAALAAGLAYGSLLITQFRGFRQFGAIGGIGMVLCWAVTFLLMPPLLSWLDRGPATAPRGLGDRSALMGRLARLVSGRPGMVAVVGAAVSVGAVFLFARVDGSRLESDFSRLRRSDTWTSGEGYWGARMDTLLGTYLSPTVMLADSPAEARALATAVSAAALRPPLKSLIAEVRGADSVVPPDQEAKIAEITKIQRLLTPITRASADPEQLGRLDQLIGTEPPTAISATTLPASFTAGLREHDGSLGRAVLVFPTLSKANWTNENLGAFAGELRRIAGEVAGPSGRPARVAGALPLSADIVTSIRTDGPLASAAAFGGVLMLVILMFRMSRYTLFVVGSLVVGVVWLVAATVLLDVKINFVNFIAFPITFGIGIDYAVNVMSRYVQDGARDIEGPIRSTGAAVGLCSMTTIIGYSSLLLAKNQGLFLFGLVAVLGEVACLMTALGLLPATLLLWERRGRRAPLEKTAAAGGE